MSAVFGEQYAGLYDHFYHDKNYVAECDLLERIFDRHGDSVRDVLDLGCGTGGHSLILAQRGYRVTGADLSLHMVERAREKADRMRAAVTPSFHVGDMRTFRVDQSFDAVVMMSAVFDYLLDDRDVLGALETARCHLRPGGLLIFDCWYGPAVDNLKTGPRTKEIATRAGRVVRSSTTQLDPDLSRCTVSFHVDEQIGGRQRQTDETHCVRYFYRPELEAFLEDAGFEPLHFGAMPDFDRPPDQSTWNAIAIARLIGPPP